MTTQTNSEPADLVNKLKDGDRQTFRQFYQETKPRLKAYLSSRISQPEDLEEVVQDSFLSFLDALPLFRGKSSAWTFLVSIARHEVADYYRKKYAKRALQFVPFIDKGYTPDLYTARETRERFVATMNQLLPEQRQLIAWKYELNWSVEKIAQKLEISVKAAESRLFRARKAFQEVYVRT